MAVHPSKKNDIHELYLMCDDIKDFIATASKHNIHCDEIQDQGWGVLMRITMPGGGKIGVYQPRHARPKPMSSPAKAKIDKSTKRKSARR
jgi:hypothetical protein